MAPNVLNSELFNEGAPLPRRMTSFRAIRFHRIMKNHCFGLKRYQTVSGYTLALNHLRPEPYYIFQVLDLFAVFCLGSLQPKMPLTFKAPKAIQNMCFESGHSGLGSVHLSLVIIGRQEEQGGTIVPLK